MSNPLVLPLLWMTDDEAVIQNSLRFRAANSAYMQRTFGSPTSSSIYTFSAWVKRGGLTGTFRLFGASTTTFFGFNSSDQLTLSLNGSTAFTSTAVFRDPGAWYHVVYQQNGSAQTCWVNNLSVATGTTAAAVFNTAIAHQIGAANTTNYFDGLMARVEFVDGQALTPSSFGQTNTTTGQWVARAYSGSYGTNGFRLTFSDTTSTTTLGYDSSGNGNNWTLTNFSTSADVTYDPSVDVPTNTYATLNPLKKTSAPTVQNANTSVYNGAGDYAATTATMPAVLDLVYVEASIETGGQIFSFGLWPIGSTLSNAGSGGTWTGGAVVICNGGGVYVTVKDSIQANSRSADSNGDVFQIAYKRSTYELWLGRNNSWFGGGDPAAGTSPTYTLTAGEYDIIASGGSAATSELHVNFGQRPFAYSPPTNFKALATGNFSTPSILKPPVQFNPVLYTGTGASLGVTGVGFQPDLVWIKSRSAATDHALYDVARGVQLQLESNTTTNETTETTGLTAFDSDGFTVGALAQVNTNTATYVAWSWKEGVTPGFDIVGYAGNNTSNRNISHGLGVAPDFVIVKSRSSGDWFAWHQNLTGNTSFLKLNATDAQTTTNTPWGTGNWSSSQFMITNDATNNANAASTNYIAYLWTEIAGFSRFGPYTGNGSSDGPFVWCGGFRPAFVLVKRVDSTGDWYMWDDQRPAGYNVIGGQLLANTTGTEGTFSDVDFTSNGFKIRNTTAGFNASGGTYVFAAFAEFPFKYANAR